MKHARNTLAVAMIASIAILAGCGGGGPDLDEVQQAMQAEVAKTTQAMRGMGAGIDLSDMVKVKSVKDCDETRDNVYTCSVEATTKIFGVTNNNTASMNFTKNSDGDWRAIR
jgi:cytochrome c556